MKGVYRAVRLEILSDRVCSQKDHKNLMFEYKEMPAEGEFDVNEELDQSKCISEDWNSWIYRLIHMIRTGEEKDVIESLEGIAEFWKWNKDTIITDDCITQDHCGVLIGLLREVAPNIEGDMRPDFFSEAERAHIRPHFYNLIHQLSCDQRCLQFFLEAELLEFLLQDIADGKIAENDAGRMFLALKTLLEGKLESNPDYIHEIPIDFFAERPYLLWKLSSLFGISKYCMSGYEITAQMCFMLSNLEFSIASPFLPPEEREMRLSAAKKCAWIMHRLCLTDIENIHHIVDHPGLRSDPSKNIFWKINELCTEHAAPDFLLPYLQFLVVALERTGEGDVLASVVRSIDCHRIFAIAGKTSWEKDFPKLKDREDFKVMCTNVCKISMRLIKRYVKHVPDFITEVSPQEFEVIVKLMITSQYKIRVIAIELLILFLPKLPSDAMEMIVNPEFIGVVCDMMDDPHEPSGFARSVILIAEMMNLVPSALRPTLHELLVEHDVPSIIEEAGELLVGEVNESIARLCESICLELA